ncbi:MAG: TraB/VirB10 family protein [Alphaproteobacteria bacterium]
MSNLKDLTQKFPYLPRMIVWGGGGLLLIGGIIGWVIIESAKIPSQHPQKDSLPDVSTPHSLMSSKELWVNRIEGKTEDIHKDVDDMRTQNQLLKQQMDVMDGIMKNMAEHQMVMQQQVAEDRNRMAKENIALDEGEFDRSVGEGEEGTFPSQGMLEQGEGRGVAKKQEQPSCGFKIFSLLDSETPIVPKDKPKVVEEIIPAGTYAAGVLTSGIAASTSLNAQSDPQPAMVRLTGKGILPKGFRSDIKEAVIIAACYGDISSERANCRLNKLLIMEHNGEVLSKKVEGWLIGDDGIPGIKGVVVDKAGPVVRGAFWSGLLSGFATYFKAAAQQPQFALTGGGAVETQKMSNSTLLQSAGANGVSNALEKIADFAIKRAEQMQPVIMVDPGRGVDVVFKEEVDLSDSTFRQEMVKKGAQTRHDHALKNATLHPIQLKKSGDTQ